MTKCLSRYLKKYNYNKNQQDYLHPHEIFGLLNLTEQTNSKDYNLKYHHKKIQKENILFIFFWFLSIITFAGCSSIKVSQDFKIGTDFRSLKTFNWKSKDQIKTGDIRIDSTLINDRIRMATEKELLKKGLAKVTNRTPDFHISYNYNISKKIHSRPITTTARYSYGAPHYHHRTTSLITGTNINEYDEILLIIDFIKPSTEIILWRGISTQIYEAHTNPIQTTKGIDETITKILAQFPPMN